MRIQIISALVSFGFLNSCVDREPKPASPPMSTVQEEIIREANTKLLAQDAVKKGEVTAVDLGRVFEMRATNQALLIDTRSGLFFKLGHIPGAVSLPKKSYEKVFPVLKPQIDAAVDGGKFLVLYCNGVKCPDARLVAKKLSDLGYSSSVYSGGWEEWKASGLD